MKEHGSPISLFSFQDIVTSLTGIMIIVILVIALQMIETMQEALHDPPPTKEYSELQQRINDLRSKLATLKNDDAPLPEGWEELLNNSPETLSSIREKEQH